MPQVHDRIVQNIFERTIGDFHIRMVQMTNQNGNQVQDEKVIQAKANHGKWNVLHCFVDNRLHPMVAQVRRKSHLLYGMMDFMKFPKPRAVM